MSNLTSSAAPLTASLLLGSCWGTPNGQDLSFPSYQASGVRGVAESILRRWSTPRGTLINAPNEGYCITDLLSRPLGPSDITYAQQQLAAAALTDARVLRITVTLTFPASGVLTVAAQGTTRAGPFSLVASVSTITPLVLLQAAG